MSSSPGLCVGSALANQRQTLGESTIAKHLAKAFTKRVQRCTCTMLR